MCSIHSQSIQYPYYRIYLYRGKRDTKIREVESTEEKDTTAVGRMQKAEKKKESGLLDGQRKEKEGRGKGRETRLVAGKYCLCIPTSTAM